MALNRSDKSRIRRRCFPGMTRSSEMSTEPNLNPVHVPGFQACAGVRVGGSVLPVSETYTMMAPSPCWGLRRSTKPKPRWDVHLPGAGNRAASFADVLRPLIAAPSGSVASPRLSGWPVRR